MAAELSPLSPPVFVVPAAKPTATVIFLHGLGGGASDWLPAVETMKHTLPHVKWVLPNAPQRCVTDREGIIDSVRTIDGHIHEIDGGIPAERIVVCGFSQGGATSLVVGLTQLGRGWKLGGVAALNSWLPLQDPDRFREVALSHLSEVPVFLCHNKGDPTVSYSRAQRTWALLGDVAPLGELGDKGLSFRSYELNVHDVCAEGLQDLERFLRRAICV